MAGLRILLVSEKKRAVFRGCRCPGRFFAEAQIALAVALLLSSYNVRLVSKDLRTAGRLAASSSGPGTKEVVLSGDARGGPSAKIGTDSLVNRTVARQCSACGCSQRHAHAGSCSQTQAHGSGYGYMGAHVSTCNSVSNSKQECGGGSMPCDNSSAEVNGSDPVEKHTSMASGPEAGRGHHRSMRESSNQGPPGDLQGLLPQPELRRHVGIRWPKSECIVSLRKIP